MPMLNVVICLICICVMGCSQEERKVNNVSLTITQREKHENSLIVNYEIHNNTSHDIWVCYDAPYIHYETLFRDSVLTIRFLRTQIPEGIFTEIQHSSYTYLKKGQTYQNKLQLSIPITIRKRFDRNAYQNSGGKHLLTAKSLELEIGYYDENIQTIKGAKKKTLEIYLIPDYYYAEENTQEKMLKVTYSDLEVPCLVR
jgi:hypothetical protein